MARELKVRIKLLLIIYVLSESLVFTTVVPCRILFLVSLLFVAVCKESFRFLLTLIFDHSCNHVIAEFISLHRLNINYPNHKIYGLMFYDLCICIFLFV